MGADTDEAEFVKLCFDRFRRKTLGPREFHALIAGLLYVFQRFEQIVAVIDAVTHGIHLYREFHAASLLYMMAFR